MADLQVTCVVPDSRDADQRIDAVGGVGFHHPIDDAIQNIENWVHSYWTRVDGRRAEIQVRQRSNGRKYLKTDADSYEPNNLLALPLCR